MLMGLWATFIGGLCFLLFPIMATPRPFEASGLWGRLLLLERSADGPAAAFPAFHVIWAFLAAWLYGRSLPAKPLWYLYASAIALSCLTTGMHSLTDLVGALCVLVLVLNGGRLWQWTLIMTERVANSWREWRIGPARIIVHGVYAGAGAFIGIALVAHLTGAAHVGYLLLVGLAALLGAGLWGQALEGSSQLSRPFGYYGAILGGAAGILVATALGADGWLLAGACSAAAPFVQATGRLRCLVQGCCHGRECAAHAGITFTREQSRVLYLANLGHRPIYPTQLYSVLYNLVIGALLLRAWTLQVPLPFVTGAYFILSGIGRFIEEAYRGEPQTPSYLGLAVYQWLALAGIVAGAFITSVEGELCNSALQILPGVFTYAAAFALVTAFAMGVDFPESKRRFSRLA